MSRVELGALIKRQAHRVEHWNRGDRSHARIVEAADDPSTGPKPDVFGVLTKRCGLGENLAKVVIRNLAPDMTESTIRTTPPEMAESTTRTTQPEMTESTIRATTSEIAESTIRVIPPIIAASMSDTTGLEGLQPVEYPRPPRRHKTIVLFGETGAGKSSLVNLMAGNEVAGTSPDMRRCTLTWIEHTISFGGDSYMIFDTVGLEEPQRGINEYLETVDSAYGLIKELDSRGGIDLLLFCIRAGNVTATLQNNYWLFHEFLCEKKVPIVLAITNLEREVRMEDWWERNEKSFKHYNIDFAGHACITAVNSRLDGRHKGHYEQSRVTIRNLVERFTADGQKQAWMGGDKLFVSLMRRVKEFLVGRSSTMNRKDLVPHLTKRLGMSREVAKMLAFMVKQDVV